MFVVACAFVCFLCVVVSVFACVCECVCVRTCVLEFDTDFNTNCLYPTKFEMFTMVVSRFSFERFRQ